MHFIPLVNRAEFFILFILIFGKKFFVVFIFWTSSMNCLSAMVERKLSFAYLGTAFPWALPTPARDNVP